MKNRLACLLTQVGLVAMLVGFAETSKAWAQAPPPPPPPGSQAPLIRFVEVTSIKYYIDKEDPRDSIIAMDIVVTGHTPNDAPVPQLIGHARVVFVGQVTAKGGPQPFVVGAAESDFTIPNNDDLVTVQLLFSVQTMKANIEAAEAQGQKVQGPLGGGAPLANIRGAHFYGLQLVIGLSGQDSVGFNAVVGPPSTVNVGPGKGEVAVQEFIIDPEGN